MVAPSMVSKNPVSRELVSAQLSDGVGQIVLNRPEALNALNTPMVRAIHRALDAWQSLGLSAVVIKSANPKFFCSGGDVKGVRQQAIDGDHGLNEEFFFTEYKLNSRLASYPAPVISLIGGLCMGGGMGLSMHGDFRLVDPTALLAMPETGIGFFPDVGASYFLSRLPGALGMYLGLTGHRLDYRDALYCGLATHFVPAGSMEMIPALLGESAGRPAAEVLALHGVRPGETGGHLAGHRAEIDWCFGAATVPGIRGRLLAAGGNWARTALERMDGSSPQSLEITLGLVLRGRQLSLDDCLDMELRTSRTVTRSADFLEGVRAALVDKDRNPRWSDEPVRQFEQFLEPFPA